MFNQIKQIISCELKILKLKKQIRSAGENELFNLKQQLLSQLEINLLHPFGFADMKQLAIMELRRELNDSYAMKPKPRINKAKKAIVVNHELVCE
jgi:hypothetical protein